MHPLRPFALVLLATALVLPGALGTTLPAPGPAADGHGADPLAPVHEDLPEAACLPDSPAGPGSCLDVPLLVDAHGDTMTGPLTMLANVRFPAGHGIDFGSQNLVGTGQYLQLDGQVLCTEPPAHDDCGDITEVRVGYGLLGGAGTGRAFLRVDPTEVCTRQSSSNVCGGGRPWRVGGNGDAQAFDVLGPTQDVPFDLVSGEWRVARMQSGPSLIVNPSSNSAQQQGTSVLGGFRNHASAFSAVIGGGTDNRAEGTLAFIGGGAANVARAPGFIGAGQNNQVNRDHAGIVAGSRNQATEYDAFIGAGSDNLAAAQNAAVVAGGGNQAMANDAFVGGGVGNRATGVQGGVLAGVRNVAGANQAVIAGGVDNTADVVKAFVGAGHDNIARGEDAAVVGGASNHVLAAEGFIGAGTGNRVLRDSASVVAGTNNRASDYNGFVGAGNNNVAGAESAAVVAGGSNQALANDAFVGGGIGNVASAPQSTVPGGFQNQANGLFSLAAGKRARADHEGAFVWASSSEDLFASTAMNEFAVRAHGGVRMETDSSGVGARLLPGSGSWSSMSDRNAKFAVEDVDERAILHGVLALPVREWSYLGQAAGVRHLGPMAQDFRAAFGLGEGPTTISTVDADGVALAAIQGLWQELQDRDARIAALEARLAALEQP